MMVLPEKLAVYVEFNNKMMINFKPIFTQVTSYQKRDWSISKYDAIS